MYDIEYLGIVKSSNFMGFYNQLRGIDNERRKQQETTQDIAAFRTKERPI